MYKKIIIVSLLTSLLMAGGALGQMPDQPLDLGLTRIDVFPEKSGTFRIEAVNSAGYVEDVGSMSIKCRLYVNGGMVGEQDIPIQPVGLCDCMQQVDHPTCDASCAPLDADCRRFMKWGLDYCYCHVDWFCSFDGVVLEEGDLVRMELDPLNSVEEWDENNNYSETNFHDVPSITQYGIVVLLTLLVITAVWLLRRKRVTTIIQ